MEATRQIRLFAVASQDVKERIEHLIDMDYLERDSGSPQMLRYASWYSCCSAMLITMMYLPAMWRKWSGVGDSNMILLGGIIICVCLYSSPL